MRAAIWSHYAGNLELKSVEIDVTKGDAKSIWGKLNAILPVYSLFQSDRKNSDSDNEIQDPLKEAVKQILSSENLQRQLATIAEEVAQKLQDVSARTLEKLREMAPDVADSLNPVIPAANALKWPDVFKGVSITGIMKYQSINAAVAFGDWYCLISLGRKQNVGWKQYRDEQLFMLLRNRKHHSIPTIKKCS